MKLSRRGFLSGLAAAVTLRLAPVYGVPVRTADLLSPLAALEAR